MKCINLPEGSIAVFDKGYNDYQQYEKWVKQKVSFVTRLTKSAVYTLLKEYPITEAQRHKGVVKDQLIMLGHDHHKKITKVKARLVTYCDVDSNRTFQFLTNNFDFIPTTIAQIYKKRW